MINGKRGLSTVVATVLILLLTIAGVAIIAGVIIPFVRDTLPKSTECIETGGYFSFEESISVGGEEFNYNCREGSLYGASIRSGVDKDLEEVIDGFEIVFVWGDGNSDKVSVREGKQSLNFGLRGNALGSVINLPKSGEVKTFVYDSSGGISSGRMEIYPVLKSGRICEINDEISIIDCGSNVNI